MTSSSSLSLADDVEECETDSAEPQSSHVPSAIQVNDLSGSRDQEDHLNEDGLIIPDYVPAKFWDEESGTVRIEDLARSYSVLERRLGAAEGNTVPEDPSDYRIESLAEGLEPDPSVNARLMEAGFTQEQAQLVYDLAAEKLAPVVQGLAMEVSGRDEKRRLLDHFGGADRWDAIAEQLQTWGEANLSEPVFDALSKSYDGILALHRMMDDGEPELVSCALPPPRGRSEDDLKKMMNNPRYWKDHDPKFISEIQQGFEKLYPDAE